MSRTAIFALSALLATLVAPALGSPLPATGSEMAKRGDYSGQVSSTPARVASARIADLLLPSAQATYFEVGEGACGWYSQDSDWVVALDSATYADGEHCGKVGHSLYFFCRTSSN